MITGAERRVIRFRVRMASSYYTPDIEFAHPLRDGAFHTAEPITMSACLVLGLDQTGYDYGIEAQFGDASMHVVKTKWVCAGPSDIPCPSSFPVHLDVKQSLGAC